MPHHKSTRRDFILYSASATLAAAASCPTLRAADEVAQAKTAADFVPGKDARLLAYNTKVGEIETPLALLREHRLTPKNLLFIRNNQVLPDSLSIAAAVLEGWKLEFTGLLDQTKTITAVELHRLPQVDQEMVLQCSGNGRSNFAKTVKADGVQWQNGAMGNVRFTGVPLAKVLEHLQISVNPAARFVAAEGADSPDKPGAADFEHSLPLAAALEKSLLVLAMNGEPLPRVHGGPVRLVTPGYYATMNVKWVQRLRFETAESTNHHHVGRYRTPLKPLTPGSKFTSTLENSEPNWNMKIKSVIFMPLDGETLASTAATTIRGVAWNDGTTKIAAVEISIDGGQAWQRTQLEPNSKPYSWHHWTTSLQLPAGQHVIQSRAIDALGRSQPLDGSIHWNPAGYSWNGVDEVRVQVG